VRAGRRRSVDVVVSISVNEMRVLVVSTPGAGHLNPLLPLVRALLDAGDNVVVASGPQAGPTVQQAGARFERAGASQGEVMRLLAERTRGVPGDGLPPERILHYFLPRAFGEVAMATMIDDVLRIGRTFAPDVVVFEAFALAGLLAADVLGVPGVAHMFGPMPPMEAVVLANDAVSPTWCRRARRAAGDPSPGCRQLRAGDHVRDRWCHRGSRPGCAHRRHDRRCRSTRARGARLSHREQSMRGGGRRHARRVAGRRVTAGLGPAALIEKRRR